MVELNNDVLASWGEFFTVGEAKVVFFFLLSSRNILQYSTNVVFYKCPKLFMFVLLFISFFKGCTKLMIWPLLMSPLSL